MRAAAIACSVALLVVAVVLAARDRDSAAARFTRGPLDVPPSGEVEVPVEKDVPAWIVAWRGQTGAALARLGDWPDGARVDAIFLVDSVSGDCCVISRLVPPPASG